MSKYDVQLTWPKSSRQSVYFETGIEAKTKGEALLIAQGRAKQEGWKGSHLKSVVTIAREAAE